MADAYLREHPPARKQYRSPRRETPSGVVAVHTAESTPDFVAFDGGAEAVARFIQGRPDPGSYHELVDSDSAITLVRWTDEAFHDATGTNPHSFGLSIATRADVWPLAPKAWRDGAIEQAAQRAAAYARWIRAEYRIVIPPHRITADQARRRIPGFVSHAQLDPRRRTDPGQDFPWPQFLARFAALTSHTPLEEDPFMALTDAEQKEILAAVRRLAPWEPERIDRQGVVRGDPKAPGSVVTDPSMRWAIETVQGVRTLLGRQATVELDPADLAAELAKLLEPSMSSLDDGDLQRIATAVADEQARRLTD